MRSTAIRIRQGIAPWRGRGEALLLLPFFLIFGAAISIFESSSGASAHANLPAVVRFAESRGLIHYSGLRLAENRGLIHYLSEEPRDTSQANAGKNTKRRRFLYFLNKLSKAARASLALRGAGTTPLSLSFGIGPEGSASRATVTRGVNSSQELA